MSCVSIAPGHWSLQRLEGHVTRAVQGQVSLLDHYDCHRAADFHFKPPPLLAVIDLGISILVNYLVLKVTQAA